jgi:oligopeptide transport system ATP-binding protein
MDMALILISHDLALVANYSQHLLVMYGGCEMEYGLTRDVLSQPRHPYSAGLLAASEMKLTKDGYLSTIPGDPPNPLSLPLGCPFETRCEHVLDKCKIARPAIQLKSNMNPNDDSECYRVRCCRVDELKK